MKHIICGICYYSALKFLCPRQAAKVFVWSMLIGNRWKESRMHSEGQIVMAKYSTVWLVFLMCQIGDSAPS